MLSKRCFFSTPSAGLHSPPGSFFLPSESAGGGGQGRGQHFQEGVERTATQCSAAKSSAPSLARWHYKEAEEATSWRGRWVDLSGRGTELQSCRVRRKTEGHSWILSSEVWGTCVLGLRIPPLLVCAHTVVSDSADVLLPTSRRDSMRGRSGSSPAGREGSCPHQGQAERRPEWLEARALQWYLVAAVFLSRPLKTFMTPAGKQANQQN